MSRTPPPRLIKSTLGTHFDCCDARFTSETGHSRPMHSAPVPINVRCYSNSDMIVRRSEVTLRAKSGHSRGLLITFRWRAVLATLCLRT